VKKVETKKFLETLKVDKMASFVEKKEFSTSQVKIEAAKIIDKYFRILRPSIQNDSKYCHLPAYIKVLTGDVVQVKEYDQSGYICIKSFNCVAIKTLDSRGHLGHIPLECIDVIKPLKFKCFLCNDANFGYDFQQAILHLIQLHLSDMMSPCMEMYCCPNECGYKDNNLNRVLVHFVTWHQNDLCRWMDAKFGGQLIKLVMLHHQDGSKNEQILASELKLYKVKYSRLEKSFKGLEKEKIEEKVKCSRLLKESVEKEKEVSIRAQENWSKLLKETVEKEKATLKELNELREEILTVLTEEKDNLETNNSAMQNAKFLLEQENAWLKKDRKYFKDNCSRLKYSLTKKGESPFTAEYDKHKNNQNNNLMTDESKKAAKKIKDLKSDLVKVNDKLKKAKDELGKVEPPFIVEEVSECKCEAKESMIKSLSQEVQNWTQKVNTVQGLLELRDREIHLLKAQLTSQLQMS
jgi:hypothetical protein